MAIDEPCQVCRQRQAYRTIGTVAYCDECAEAFLGPIRARVIAKYGHVDTNRETMALRARPDHGRRMWDLECIACGATWVGADDDVCGYCAIREERQLASQRDELLFPSWYVSSDGNWRYDRMDEASKAVWNRTRGISTHADPIKIWIGRLADAIRDGSITMGEAESAIKRMGAKR